MKKVKLKKRQSHRVKLIRPPDSFYLWGDYKDKFMSGNVKSNKKHWHTLTVVSCVKGVIVPAGNGGQPWHVQREAVDSLDKEDVIHSGDSSDEVDPDDVQAQFEEMSTAANEAYDQ